MQQILGMILGIVMAILGSFLGGGQMGGNAQAMTLGPNAPTATGAAPATGPAQPAATPPPGTGPVTRPVNASFAPAGNNQNGGNGTPAQATGQGDTTTPEGRRNLMIQALQLSQVAQPTEENIRDLNTIVERESSWDPGVTNTTDSNARAGRASTGLMQTIPTTFQENALPGYDSNINDPLSNLIAGIRYAVRRYGSLQEVPGVKALREGRAYVGY